jgi:hypothetical protein
MFPSEMKNADRVLKAGDLVSALIHKALCNDGDTSRLSAPARSIVELAQNPAAILRGAVEAGSTDADSPSNWASGLAAYRNGGAALLSLLHSGYFDAALPDMRPGAVRSDFQVLVNTFTGHEGAEGVWKSLDQFAITGARVEPRKVYAVCALTETLLRLSGAGPLVTATLRDAVISATDKVFLDALATLATPTPSSGRMASDVANDCAVALAAIATGPGAKIHWAAGVDVVKRLLTMNDASGARAFPGLTLAGGPFMGGQLRATSHLSTSVVVIDASAFVGAAGELITDSSRVADLALENGLTGAAAKQLTSMWQTNSCAFKAERFGFGFEPLHDAAVAILSGVTWGVPESGE